MLDLFQIGSFPELVLFDFPQELRFSVLVPVKWLFQQLDFGLELLEIILSVDDTFGVEWGVIGVGDSGVAFDSDGLALGQQLDLLLEDFDLFWQFLDLCFLWLDGLVFHLYLLD